MPSTSLAMTRLRYSRLETIEATLALTTQEITSASRSKAGW
jgi:hypothetical protein